MCTINRDKMLVSQIVRHESGRHPHIGIRDIWNLYIAQYTFSKLVLIFHHSITSNTNAFIYIKALQILLTTNLACKLIGTSCRYSKSSLLYGHRLCPCRIQPNRIINTTALSHTHNIALTITYGSECYNMILWCQSWIFILYFLHLIALYWIDHLWRVLKRIRKYDIVILRSTLTWPSRSSKWTLSNMLISVRIYPTSVKPLSSVAEIIYMV